MREPADLPLHESLLPLAFLLGTWRGTGSGGYPTIDPFDYEEELRFDHVGDTFLLYQEATWAPADGAPIHFERGFLRPGEPGQVEFTLAHPIGLTEIAEGALEDMTFELVSTGVGRTTTGLTTTSVIRRYQVDGDVMRYRTDMATDATPMTLHLEAELTPGRSVSDEPRVSRDLTILWLAVSVVGIAAGGVAWASGSRETADRSGL